jgi:serine/threonine protein kinase
MPQGEPLGPQDPVRIGRYTVLARLGRGGQGIVYLAEDHDQSMVVVKVLRPELVSDPASRARQVREVTAAQQVASFCTAAVIEADLDGDLPHIVIEYVEGPTVGDHVQEAGPITGAALIRLAIGMTTAMVAIHGAGVIHRDVKPANVILGPDGPRVIDFGIAKKPSMDITTTGVVLGTPGYMAPEQFAGHPVGRPADIFSLASTLVFAATGNPPFSAPSVAALAHQVLHEPPRLDGVPEDLGAVLLPCLDKDPARRPTADQVLMSLLNRPTGEHRDPAAPSPFPAPSSLTPDRSTTPLRDDRGSEPGTTSPVVLSVRGAHRSFRGRSRGLVLLVAGLPVLIVGGLLLVLWVSFVRDIGTGSVETRTPTAVETSGPIAASGSTATGGDHAAVSSAASVHQGMPVSVGAFFGYITDVRTLDANSWVIVFDPVTAGIDIEIENTVDRSYQLVVDASTTVETQAGSHQVTEPWDQETAAEILRLHTDDPGHERILGYEITVSRYHQVTYIKRYSTRTVWNPDIPPFSEPEAT